MIARNSLRLNALITEAGASCFTIAERENMRVRVFIAW